MSLALLEDDTLYTLAKTVVPEGGSDVDNSQITGLLSTVRASGSWALLRNMSQHQFEKARKDGERAEGRAAFYDRLLKALRDVERYADEHVRERLSIADGKLDRQQKQEKEQVAGRLSLMLMTHVAAEHRWQRSAR